MGHRAMTIMSYRDARAAPSSAQPSLRGAYRLALRPRFALVTNEIIGVLRPYPTLVESRWLIRLNTVDQRATLRARTALARWNTQKTQRILVFQLRPRSMGEATFSMGWEGVASGSRTTSTEIDVASAQGTM